jgi:hypothetical protein
MIKMKLERMDNFFAARVEGYDEHMRATIEGADDFYAYTASLLPPERMPVSWIWAAEQAWNWKSTSG